jgi:hypothetical protein
VSQRLEKLAASGIQVIPGGPDSHYIVEREGFVAFIERRGGDFGNVGAPGLMTERGFAALVWRADRAFFQGRGFEQPATDEQVQKLRSFALDLERAIVSERPS